MGQYLQKIKKWKSIALKKHNLPPFLIVFVTNKCNLRCRHCFYWNNTQDPNLKDLTLLEFENLSKQLGRVYNLLISGGEPFLRMDLRDICELFYKNNGVKKISIPTNGFVPEAGYKGTKKILDTLPDVKLEINLSIDGFEETHDYIRGKDNSFNKALESCDLLVDLKKEHENLKLYISTTISNANVEQLPAFTEFIEGNISGIDGHRFAFFRGTCEDENIYFPSDNLDEIKSFTAPKNTASIESRLDNILLNAKIATLRQKKQVFRCFAGRLIGVIDNNGDVRLCELFEPIGNIKEDSFQNIWHSKTADQQRERIEKGECYCTHECFIAPSIMYNVKNLVRGSLCYS